MDTPKKKPKRRISFHEGPPVVINNQLAPELLNMGTVSPVPESKQEGDILPPSNNGDTKTSPTTQDEKKDTQEHKEPPTKQEEKLSEKLVLAAVVAVSVLVVFVAASNTLTWHVQRFWGASGDFWQNQWDKIYDYFEGDPRSMYMTGTFVVLSLVFFTLNAFLLMLDIYSFPEQLIKYKIQINKNRPVELKKLGSAVAVVFFNQTVVSLPMVLVFYHLTVWRGCSFDRKLPSFHWVVFELVVFNIIREFLFYYSHRLLHHPRLYKHIHKKHHEWTAPIGLVAQYAHPVEHIISNVIPVLAAPVMLGSHIASTWLWAAFVLTESTTTHSGYHLPFVPISPEFHDYHHFKFNCNYGVFGFLDRFHNTDNMFRMAMASKRHRVLWGLTPLSKTYPEPSKETTTPKPEKKEKWAPSLNIDD